MTSIEQQAREAAEQVRSEGFDDGYLAGKTFNEMQVATLRARVAELEGMVPKWCDLSTAANLLRDGWIKARHHSPPPTRMVTMILMVPPIPLPGAEK